MHVVLFVFYLKCPAGIQGEESSCWTEGRVKAWLSVYRKMVSFLSCCRI